jgi:hypothetical protein
MNSFQVVLEKVYMNNFLLSEEITSAFPKLLGNCSWVLGQCIKAPQILYEMIQDVKAIDSDLKLYDIVAPVFRRNAFCCLGENFLASLLFSDDQHHRQVAVNKILQIRSHPSKDIASVAR